MEPIRCEKRFRFELGVPGLERSLAEYLSHAAVFVRTVEGEIVYWTVGCQEVYGYSIKQARGRISHELLQTVFPAPLSEIERELRAMNFMRRWCEKRINAAGFEVNAGRRS